jgi:2-(3-amino-3-carboxypropyl)histidine synthase
LRILLQFPEGLKQEALKHAKKLEAEGHEVFVSASPSFGACDIAVDEAKRIGADKIVHFGHAEFKPVDFKVEYVEYGIYAPLDVLYKSLKLLEKYDSLCIVTTIQHVQQLGEIRKFYEEHGKKVSFNKPSGFTKVDGQILGCDPGNVASLDSSVDAFLYFGGGSFHPICALMQTKKPFFIADPFRDKVEEISELREVINKRSRGKVLASLKAKSFGILVSTKTGQYNMELAKTLKRSIEAIGADAAILVANTFDFDSLNNMLEFDAFVNTACPRVGSDDTERLRRPLLTATELYTLIALKEKGA